MSREAFLLALAKNEDDVMTRLVYADWLDERGEHEEADRQRRWTAAKAWLVQFCETNNHHYDESDDDYYLVMTYARMIPLAQQAADDGDFIIDCRANEDMCDALRQNRMEFWSNWSIVTGVPLPSDIEKRARFGCSC